MSRKAGIALLLALWTLQARCQTPVDDVPEEPPEEEAETPAPDAPIPSTDAPDTTAPSTPIPATISVQPWCSTNEHCREFGDVAATCVMPDNGGDNECRCGTGYTNPVEQGVTAYICFPEGTEPKVPVSVTMSWENVACSLFESMVDDLTALLSELYGGRVGTLQPLCGSLSVFARVVDASPVKAGTVDLKSAMQQQINNYPALKVVGVPDATATTTSSKTCNAGMYALSSASDTRGRCNAVTCEIGFEPQVDTNAGGALRCKVPPRDPAVPIVEPWCRRWSQAQDCRREGDTTAMCGWGDYGEPNKCECGNGFVNPSVRVGRNNELVTLGICVAQGTQVLPSMTVAIYYNLVCSSYDSTFQWDLRMALEELGGQGSRVVSIVGRCAEMVEQQTRRDILAVFARLENVRLAGAYALATTPEGYLKQVLSPTRERGLLGAWGSTTPGPCTTAWATATAQLNGQCHALECSTGYRVWTSNEFTPAPPTPVPDTRPPMTRPPVTIAPTASPLTKAPDTMAPTIAPTTLTPTGAPATITPTQSPATPAPATSVPTSNAPLSSAPNTMVPTTAPVTWVPTGAPLTNAPQTAAPAPPTIAPAGVARGSFARSVCTLIPDTLRQEKWCNPGSTDCRAFGDGNADCIREISTGVGQCRCSGDFINPIVGGEKLFICVRPNTNSVPATMQMSWGAAACNVYTSSFEGSLKLLLARITGGVVDSIVNVCGSIHTVSRVNNVRLSALLQNPQQAAEYELRNNGNLYGEVTTLGAPTSAGLSVSSGCASGSTGVAYSAVDSLGRCIPVQCLDGYRFQTNNGNPICVELPRDRGTDDDDDLTGGAIAGIVIGCILCVGIVLAVVAYTTCFKDDTPAAPHEHEPATAPDEPLEPERKPDQV